MNAFLNKLTVVALKKPMKQSPAEQRRGKLVSKLEEQIALCHAQMEGKQYIVTKPSWQRDEHGVKTRVQRERVVKPWFWADGTGLCLVIRYGARVLELAKNRRAIAIGDLAAVPETLALVRSAVENGELDNAIEASIASAKSKSVRS